MQQLHQTEKQLKLLQENDAQTHSLIITEELLCRYDLLSMLMSMSEENGPRIYSFLKRNELMIELDFRKVNEELSRVGECDAGAEGAHRRGQVEVHQGMEDNAEVFRRPL